MSALLVMVGGAGLAAGLTVLAAHHANDRVLRHEAVAAGEHARIAVASILTSRDLSAPLSGERLQEVQRAVRERVLQGPTIGLTIWGRDGTVIYADDSSLIGHRAGADQGISDALAGARTLRLPEDGGAPGLRSVPTVRSVRVLAPLQLGDRVEGAVEALWDPSGLEAELAAIDRFRALTALAGVLIFWVALLLLARWVGYRLEHQQGVNLELARSLESSEEERSRVLLEAQRTRARFDLLARAVESADETIIVYGLDGRIHYANPAVRQVHGYEPAELVGQNIRIFQPPTRRPLAERIIAQASGGVWRGEVNILRKDGTEIPIHLSASSVRDEEGVPMGMVSVGRDLSEQRTRMAELVEARSEAAAFRRAEAIKSDLIATVSHELRTPLTALQGFSELLLTRSHTEDERRLWTETIHSETVRLAQLLDDMLSVSRLEAGAVQLRLEAVVIADVARRIARTLELQAAGHTIIVHSDPEHLRAMADPGCLAQILENLVSNAIKYSPAGGELQIGVRRDVQTAIVSVTDQGIGIPPDQLPRLFTRFHRLEAVDQSGTRGAGLGLYIVQQLVTLHGGVIWVSSQPGRGSTFTFTLPVATESLSKVALRHEEDHAGGRRPRDSAPGQRDAEERRVHDHRSARRAGDVGPREDGAA